MSLVRGSNVNVLVAKEATRGTFSEPTVAVPARTPSGITVKQEKYVVAETRANGVDSVGSEIVKQSAEGDLEFNVRNSSIVFFLLSLLGKITSTTQTSETAVYKHVLEVETSNPQKPVLSLGLSQPNGQDYGYTTAGVSKLELKTPVNELVNATASFMATTEVSHADFTVAFASNDYPFRQQDVKIYVAADVAGLDSATALKPKEFSFTPEDSDMKDDQFIGNLNPSDVLAGRLKLEGKMKFDYNDTTNHDMFTGGTYKAMRIEMERSDITIGNASHPKITIDLPRVSFENYSPDRPLDGVVGEEVDFKAHYDATEAKAIVATVINETVSY